MGSRSAALLAVSLPSFVYGLFRFSIGILVPQIEGAYGINDSLMGAIVSVSVGVVGIGVFVSGNVAGRVRQQDDHRRSGLLLFSLSHWVMAAGVSLTVFLRPLSPRLARLGSDHPHELLASWPPSSRRGGGSGAALVTSAYNLGGLVGPAIGRLPSLVLRLERLISDNPRGRLRQSSCSSLPYRAGRRRSRLAEGSVQASAGQQVGSADGDRGLPGRRRLRDVPVLDAEVPAYLLRRLRQHQRRWSTSSSASVSGWVALGIFVAGFLYDRIGGRTSAIIGGVAATGAALGVYLSSSLLRPWRS